MTISLAGQTAVVTGGAGSIGQAIAQHLAQAGARVIIADINAEKAQKIAHTLDPTHQKILAHQLDVISSDSTRSLIKHFGPIHIWVNNAGGRPQQALLDITDADFDAVVRLNLHGAFTGAREAAQHMITHKIKGTIINIASVTGLSNSGSPAHYVAAKHALVGLTKTLAVELGPHGIRAIAIAPTATETAGIAAERAAGHGSELDAYAASLHLGRLAQPADIADAVVFAASDQASFITGSTIAVDGGDLAR